MDHGSARLQSCEVGQKAKGRNASGEWSISRYQVAANNTCETSPSLSRTSGEGAGWPHSKDNTTDEKDRDPSPTVATAQHRQTLYCRIA